MGFRFSLDTLLRLRLSLEEREQLRLQALLARHEQCVDEKEKTRQAQAALRVETVNALNRSSLPASEVQFSGQRADSCAARIQQLNAILAAIEQEIARQRTVYLQCRRNREVLEGVRQQKQREYLRERERREQARAEELTLLRRERVAR